MSVIEILNSFLGNGSWTLAEVHEWNGWITALSSLIIALGAAVILLIVIYVVDNIAHKVWKTQSVWSDDMILLPLILVGGVVGLVLAMGLTQADTVNKHVTSENIADNIEASDVNVLTNGTLGISDRVEAILYFDETGERLFQDFVYNERHELMVPLDTPEKLEVSVIEGSELDQLINKTSNSAE